MDKTRIVDSFPVFKNKVTLEKCQKVTSLDLKIA